MTAAATKPIQQVEARRLPAIDQPVQSTDNLKALLDRAKGAIADVIPKHLTPDRMLKMALIAASRQPKLLQCTGASVLQAIMRASELGLDCSGTLGDGYLVPFKRNFKDERNQWHSVLEAQFIPGYRGLINLARRSGNIQAIEARVVYQNDDASVDFGQENPIKHKPRLVGERGNVVWFYAMAWVKGSDRPQVEVMTFEEIEAIRKRSLTYDKKTGEQSGPWDTDWSEMGRKTVVKRLAKYLPLSPELEQAIAIDNETDSQEGYVASVVNAGDQQASLADKLRAKAEATRAIEAPPASIDQPSAERAETVSSTPPDPDAKADADKAFGGGNGEQKPEQQKPATDDGAKIGTDGEGKLIDALAAQQKCAGFAAAKKLKKFAGDMFQKDIDSLTKAEGDQIAQLIAKGEIKVPK